MSKRFRIAHTVRCALGLVAFFGASAFADTIRVPGDQPTIQAGIDAAADGDVVLIADGVYTGPDNKNLDFGGKAITVRGENGRDNCIIDCEQDGRGFFLHSEESGAAIDGLTIRNGASFDLNETRGGAIFCGTGTRVAITRCRILSNQGVGGGAFCGVESRIDFSDCEFVGNRDYDLGGGALSCDRADVTLRHCCFVDNHGAVGGAAYAAGGRLELEDCTFDMNLAYNAGAVRVDDGELIARRCEFNDNTVHNEERAGAIRVSHSLVSFDNCRFARNRADSGGAILAEFCEMTIRECEFNENNLVDHVPHYGGGGAISARAGSTQIERSIFVENTAHSGGAIAASGEIVFRQCRFERNRSARGDFGGGGAIWFSGSGGRIEDCIFDNNGPADGGGAIGCSNVTIKNCLFRRNHDASGGAAVSAGNDTIINNCTFTENSAPGGFGGGVLVRRDAHVTISNSILWENSDVNGQEEGSQIYLDGGTVAVDYSCVQGLTGNLGGDGNIGDDPQFVDPDNGDLHLLPDSPAIDAGDPDFVPVPGETDIDGQKRIWNARVDMGSDEFGSFAFGDINCDGAINAFDIEPFLLALFEPDEYAIQYPNCDINLGDVNGDGLINAFDIEPFVDLLFGP